LLLELLDQYEVKVTFFVTGERVVRHGELIGDILGKGHDIGNHSYTHDVFLMLRTAKRMAREVEETQSGLRSFGIAPLAFRPPVGITNPKLGPVLHQQGLFCVNFSCRAWDGGNRFVRGMARRVLKKVKPDDIIVLHDVCPPGAAATGDWLEEVKSILSGLKAKGLGVIPLAALLGKSVMVRTINDGQ
jgi:peptidoglycan/xylan/chitin deacetylase (PgdA/CDA1 family)